MNKKKAIGLSLGAIIVLVLLVALVLILGNESQEEVQDTETEETVESVLSAEELLAQWDTSSIQFEGENYELKDELTTVLFMGIDQFGELDSYEEEGDGGRSDSLILLILNSELKTVEMLEISRDTMTPIQIFDEDGEYFTTAEMQITMQYSFGDGGKRSCMLTEQAVSTLLYDLQIDHYLSLNLDGLSAFVEAIGGITIEMTKDYTYIEETFVEGAMVELDGELTEKYVRYRDITEHNSNEDRMERQQNFIFTLLEEFQDMGMMEASNVWAALEPYMVTDLDLGTIEELSDYEFQEELLMIPGTNNIGQNHDEFIVDDEALKELVIDVFYDKVE